MKTNDNKEKKTPVLFTCCNFTAIGFRGAHRTESGIQRYAQCPKCGKRVNLGGLK